MANLGGKEKGWACSTYGCGHNFATRWTCRWCGAPCPAQRAHRQVGNWFPGKWYQQQGGSQHQRYYANRYEAPVDRSAPVDAISGKNKIAELNRDIASLKKIEGSEQLIADKQLEIKLRKAAQDAPRPKSQILAGLENRVKQAKNHQQQVQTKLEEKETKLAYIKEEVDE